jgi:flagellar basal-body rod protein FlgF
MADGIYVGMSGAVARTQELDSLADNLANAATPGYKAERPAFASFLPSQGAAQSAHPAAVSTGVDLRPGATSHTGNALDLRPDGSAFFGVLRPDGQVAYTRDGRAQVDAEGNLRMAGERLVSTSGNPVTVPPQSRPTVTADGDVVVDGRAVDRLALFHLSGPLQHAGPGQLLTRPGGAATPATEAVRSGELELGNYSALEAAVHMVTAQRSFETSMQAIQTYKQLGDRANEIGRVK